MGQEGELSGRPSDEEGEWKRREKGKAGTLAFIFSLLLLILPYILTVSQLLLQILYITRSLSLHTALAG